MLILNTEIRIIMTNSFLINATIYTYQNADTSIKNIDICNTCKTQKSLIKCRYMYFCLQYRQLYFKCSYPYFKNRDNAIDFRILE